MVDQGIYLHDNVDICWSFLAAFPGTNVFVEEITGELNEQ